MFERFDQDWADEMIGLLLDAKEAVEKAVAQGHARLDATTVHSIRVRYGKLVAKGWAMNERPTRAATGKWYQHTAVNLLNRLDADRADVLRFSVDFKVPFDNNQGERDIRMVESNRRSQALGAPRPVPTTSAPSAATSRP